MSQMRQRVMLFRFSQSSSYMRRLRVVSDLGDTQLEFNKDGGLKFQTVFKQFQIFQSNSLTRSLDF